MIHIEYYRAPERFALSVKGHAGFAPAGRDIVCAAVSVLVSELSLALEQAAESGEILRPFFGELPAAADTFQHSDTPFVVD